MKPHYVASGRTPAGRRVTKFVSAKSCDQAVQTLRDRGYSDIVLHTDDAAALFTVPRGPAKAYVAARYQKGFLGHFLFTLRTVYGTIWFALVVSPWAALMAYEWWTASMWPVGEKWPIGLTLLLFFLGMPFVLALTLQLRSPRWRYDRLMRAISWHRWEEAQQLLPDVRDRLPPSEAEYCQARVLAGLGKLDEALSVVRPVLAGDAVPAWFAWDRLAAVFTIAGQHAKALATVEKAVELAPGNPTVLTNLALLLLRRREDLLRVQDLLDRASAHAISDVLAPAHAMAVGILALEQGQAAKALPMLERAREGFHAFRHASPLIGVLLDEAHTYLALTHAALGDRAAAERHYCLAEPRLWALKREDLRRRCEEALGVTAGG